jgi:capsular polysaccharide biosynthesis protein
MVQGATVGAAPRSTLAVEEPWVSAHAASRRLAGDYPDLRAVGFALRRGWWVVVLCALACAALAATVASRAEVRYEASAGMLVGPAVGDLGSVRAAGDRAPTYAGLATSRRVVAAARTRLGLRESVDRLLGDVSTRADGSSRLLTITAQAASADGAARLANAVATELGPSVFRDPLAARRELHLVDPAVPPRHPIASSGHVLTAFAGIAGALAGLTLLLLVDYARGRITTGAELAGVSGAPLLATLRTGRSATGFDVLAARTTLDAGGTPPGSVLVAGDGAAAVADGLADAYERSGRPAARVTVPPRAVPATLRAALHGQAGRTIVLDAPAPDRDPAALTCARLADATVLVARRGRTSRAAAAQSAAALRDVGGALAGVALVERERRLPSHTRAGTATGAPVAPAGSARGAGIGAGTTGSRAA